MPEKKEKVRGLQLWVNLPKDMKDLEPSYEIYRADQLPTEEDKILQKTVVGPNSPVTLKTKITYNVLELDHASFWWHIPEAWNGFLYLIDGECHVEDLDVSSGEFLVKNFSDELRTKILAKETASCIVVSGSPLDEPIKQRGPFVE